MQILGIIPARFTSTPVENLPLVLRGRFMPMTPKLRIRRATPRHAFAFFVSNQARHVLALECCHARPATVAWRRRRLPVPTSHAILLQRNGQKRGAGTRLHAPGLVSDRRGCVGVVR